MGTFAETAIIDYCLLFADQEKQTSVFHFCLQLTNRSLSVLFYVSRKQTEVAVSHFFCFPYIYIASISNSNPGDFPNSFIICSSFKRKFVVGPCVDEETRRSYPFSNVLNRLACLCILGMKTWLKINCL
jgi:hypothetical protein